MVTTRSTDSTKQSSANTEVGSRTKGWPADRLTAFRVSINHFNH